MTLWAGNRTATDVFLKQSVINQVRQVLEDNNIQYSVQIEDLQQLIELEATPFQANAPTNRGWYSLIYNINL